MTAARTKPRAVRNMVTATPEIVNVTPEIAEEWLNGNTVNRKIRADAVYEYADDMTAGRWTISDSAICFSPDGKLLNGQHRLCAVISSGATVAMLILRNVPPEAMGNMDSGRKRTMADVFSFEQENNAAALASSVRLALLYTDGRIYKDRKVQGTSKGAIKDFLAEHPELRLSVTFAYTGARGVDLSPSARAVAHWLFARAAGYDAADEFFESLSSRIGLTHGSPLLALDSRLRELRRSRTRLTHREELYLLAKTWNYWREGRSVRVIAARPKGSDIRIPELSA